MSSYTYKYTHNSILRISNFTQNSILLKLSFKNRGILLNNFKTGVLYYIVLKLWANAHFPLALTPQEQ